MPLHFSVNRASAAGLSFSGNRVSMMSVIQGPQGIQGDAATIEVGNVTTGAAGSSATVTNAGTTSEAVFDFEIPRGDTGATGTAATIAVGNVTTGAAGSSATVTNTGSSAAAVFDFAIPRGDPGTMGGTLGSTDNVVPRADGTGGTTLQGSVVTIADTTGVIAGTQGVTFNGSSSGTTALVPTAAASGTLTLPAATDTLVGKDTTDELTNKTLTSSVGKGTWTASGTWTLPALTLGGAITYGGVTLTNAVTGTGKMVLDTSPTLVTPILGTPTSGTLTNCTGLPAAGLVASTSQAVGFGTIELGHATDTTISRASAGRIAVEGVNVPTVSSTDTLTNKRRTRRLTTTNAPGATPTTNTDNVDVMSFTGLATAITSMTTNLSGTPVEGDLLEFKFLDNGTARGITWGASFAASTIALPTTTVISTTLRVGFEWSGSVWRCIGVA